MKKITILTGPIGAVAFFVNLAIVSGEHCTKIILFEKFLCRTQNIRLRIDVMLQCDETVCVNVFACDWSTCSLSNQVESHTHKTINRDAPANQTESFISNFFAIFSAAKTEYVTCGSVIKLRNVDYDVGLHSHDVRYGTGSGQQSVTGTEQREDVNSYWAIWLIGENEFSRG